MDEENKSRMSTNNVLFYLLLTFMAFFSFFFGDMVLEIYSPSVWDEAQKRESRSEVIR